MNMLAVMAAAALGIEVGWRPMEQGGLEYTVQIEPVLVDSLRRGERFISDVPRGLGRITHIRVIVGDGELERIASSTTGEPPTDNAAGDPTAAEHVLLISEDQLERLVAGEEVIRSLPDDLRGLGQLTIALGDPATPLPATPDATTAVTDAPVDVTAMKPDEGPPATVDNVAPPRSTFGGFGRSGPQPATDEQQSGQNDAAHKPPVADPPRRFIAQSGAKPLEQQVGYREGVAGGATPSASVDWPAVGEVDEAGSENDSVVPSAMLTLPWHLTLALVGLFASVGGNLYLGWVTWTTRSRYRQLLADQIPRGEGRRPTPQA